MLVYRYREIAQRLAKPAKPCGRRTSTQSHPIDRTRSVRAAARIHCFIDRTDLFAPAPPFRMLHRQDVGIRPVKVISDERYLCIKLVRNGSASTFPGTPPASPPVRIRAASSPMPLILL